MDNNNNNNSLRVSIEIEQALVQTNKEHKKIVDVKRQLVLLQTKMDTLLRQETEQRLHANKEMHKWQHGCFRDLEESLDTIKIKCANGFYCFVFVNERPWFGVH